MLSSGNTPQTRLQDRYGVQTLESVQEKMEKILNLKTLLNLVKQSKSIMKFVGAEYDIISGILADLEHQVTATIRVIKAEAGLV